MADPVIPLPDRLVELPGGRRVALDDRGDDDGSPVLYCHGSPDSRFARHPDDSLAAIARVRLLAADRPGIGHSDVDPDATPTSVADDLAAVLDHLGIERVGVLSWSTGAIHALAFAGTHPDRCRRVVLAAPLVPADAYDDPTVLDGSDDARRLFADAHRGMDPGDVGAELAPWLVPPVIDDATAREMMAGSITALADIPGADDQLALAVRASVAAGMTGVERDIAAQATRLDALLDRITATASVHVGADDAVTPPAMARWIGRRLDVRPQVHDGIGHELAIRRWADLLQEAAAEG
ncbi:MAG TPA: alpha/beta hydrolase [Acidimicrobiales bacterium]|nr:alpha/beta hydrolase [Acidimicrobiales bacterium]